MTSPAEQPPYALSRDEGQSIWFLGTLVTVKAGAAATGNGFTLIEQVLPPGFAPRRMCITPRRRPSTSWRGN